MAGTDSSQIIYFEEPSIILMEVQLPENLGMVMRAMLNFGFKKLRLVKPKIDWKDTKVKSSSAGAFDTISSTVKVYESLEKSIEDILRNIDKLSNHLNSYKNAHESLGKTIKTAVNQNFVILLIF